MNRTENFRVVVKFKTGDKRDETKFYIYLDLEALTKVKHVEKHIATLFKLKNRMRLYINDVYLPRGETVQIIMPGDVLTVYPPHPLLECESCYKARELGSVKENKTVEETQQEKLDKMDLEVSVDESLEQVLGELKSKYQELKNCSEGKSEEQKEDLALFEPERKKRRRCRRRKVKDDKDKLNPEMNISPQPVVPVRPISPKGNGMHIRFEEESHTNGIDETEKPEITTNVTQLDSKASPDPVEKNCIEDWKQNLLNLAKNGKNKFFRSKEQNTLSNGDSNGDMTEITNEKETEKITNGQPNGNNKLKNIDIVNCPIVDNFNPYDLIIFKKLKLDENYCPIESNHILGQIIEISKDTLTIDIQEGAEELAPPQGKFYLEESTHENPEVDTIVELQKSELLEIRLVPK
ncbi:uncharacterized protein LOC106668021 [Cimex lectularius]|uniref:Coilin N-terminal domain-containing protein n=1 Tax=Cimex lectularius TaxID=79782 RepID=A0A8I6TIF5_CIMLE|nr:uncharacterized protein LOC106668021 [Cimex lectularius]